MLKSILVFLVVFMTLNGGYLAHTYMQHFNQDSKTSATSGWYFQTTLNLEEYKNVSTGNDLWGTFDRYTRSDRHTETITVYCNSYCKE